MLWYKDKTKSQLWFERVALIIAIAVISYTLGFMYQKLKDNVCRNLQKTSITLPLLSASTGV